MTNDDAAQTIHDLRAFTESLQAKVGAARAEIADLERDRRQHGDAAARARRDGDHGPAWQQLQQRIDLNQTTLRDVLTGVDHSPEAQEVRRTLSTRTVDLRRSYVAATEDDGAAPTLAALRQAQEELAHVMQQATRNPARG